MTGLHDAREFIVERGMDAQAANAAQARLLYDPSPAVDSLAEVFGQLARMQLPDRERLVLVARGMRLTRAIAAGNQLERGHVHALTGAAERIGRSSLTVKDAARRLRAPLGDLANPVILGSRREQARDLVIGVLNDAPAGLLHDERGRPRAGIAGELNSTAKTSALAQVIGELIHSRETAA